MELQWSTTATSNTKGEIVKTEGPKHNTKRETVESEGKKKHNTKEEAVESDSKEKHNTKEEVVESDCERDNKEERLKENQEIRGAIMVIAILGATVAYQAILNPPGGFWQDDLQSSNSTKGHTIGEPVMATKNPGLYGIFIAFNLAAFGISFLVMMILFLPSFVSSMKREPLFHKYLKWMNINNSSKSIEVNERFLLRQYLVWVYYCLFVALALWIFQHLRGLGLVSFFIANISISLVFIPILFQTLKRVDTTSTLRRNSV